MCCTTGPTPGWPGIAVARIEATSADDTQPAAASAPVSMARATLEEGLTELAEQLARFTEYLNGVVTEVRTAGNPRGCTRENCCRQLQHPVDRGVAKLEAATYVPCRLSRRLSMGELEAWVDGISAHQCSTAGPAVRTHP